MRPRPPILAALAISTILPQSASAQSSHASIRGTVVGSDGTPIAGAHVYAAMKVNVAKAPAPPTLVTFVAGASTPPIPKGTMPPPGNPFLISNLAAGSYVLCAQTPAPGWLDPCHWSSSVPVVTLTANQNLTGQTVVMTKGAVVQIRVNDPSKLLTRPSAAVAHDVEVVVFASNKGYYNATIASTDPFGRNLQLTLPFTLTHTLTVRSQQFALADSNGAAVPAAGRSQLLQVSPTAVAPSLAYTVTGRLH